MKTIYIHIGSPKTGSSAIQAFLSKNYNLLLGAGFYYPQVGRGYRDGKFNLVNPAVWMNGNVLNNLSQLKALLKKFNGLKAQNLILSDECLFLNGSNQWYTSDVRKHLNDYNVRLIVYLRPAPDYLAGIWQERIKYNATETLDAALKKDVYLKCLNDLKHLIVKVKKENVNLRIYTSKKLHRECSVFDFAKTIKLTKYVINSAKDNKSLDRGTANRVLYFNRLAQLTINDQSKLYEYFTNHSDKSTPIVNSIPKETYKSIALKHSKIEGQIGKLLFGKNLFERDDFTNKFVRVTEDLGFIFRGKAWIMAKFFSKLIPLNFKNIRRSKERKNLKTKPRKTLQAEN